MLPEKSVLIYYNFIDFNQYVTHIILEITGLKNHYWLQDNMDSESKSKICTLTLKNCETDLIEARIYKDFGCKIFTIVDLKW